MRIRDGERWLVGAALLCFGLIAVTLELPAEEDAFIYYRYAWNAAHRHGLVFNLGDPVEGFSGPAWMGLLALIARAGLDLPTTASVVGLLCGAATLLATWYLGRAAGLDRFGRLAALTALALSYPFIVWSRSGLETPVYSLAITVVAFAYLAAEYPLQQDAERSGRYRWSAALVLVLVTLGRPEGLLLVIVVVVDRLTDGRDVAGAFRYASPSVLGYGGYLLWRAHTFHSLVPNTSVKLYPLLFDRSLSQFVGYVTYLGILPACLPVLALVTNRGARSERRRLRLLFAAVCLLSFGFNFLAGGDYRPGFRYFIPTLPLLLVAIWLSLELSRLTSHWTRSASTLLLMLLIAAPLRLLWLNPPRLHDWRPRVFDAWRHPLRSSSPDVDIARWLDAHARQDGVVAFGQMGKVPYALARSGHNITFIDTLGLVDRQIARVYRVDTKVAALWHDVAAGMSVSDALDAGRRERADRVAASILDRHPDFILVETALENYQMMRALSESARFRADYRELGGFPFGRPPDVRIFERASMR